MIELIVAYLDITYGIEQRIEEGVIRFFQFVSNTSFPVIIFKQAINTVPVFTTPIFIADPSNNQNNAARKVTPASWQEIKREADDAFESLNIAQAKGTIGETINEWKYVFGPNFSIEEIA